MSPGPAIMKSVLTIGLDETLSTIERDAILFAIKKAKGNKAAAARLLKIGRSTLVMKCKRLGIPLRLHWSKRPECMETYDE